MRQIVKQTVQFDVVTLVNEDDSEGAIMAARFKIEKMLKKASRRNKNMHIEPEDVTFPQHGVHSVDREGSSFKSARKYMDELRHVPSDEELRENEKCAIAECEAADAVEEARRAVH